MFTVSAAVADTSFATLFFFLFLMPEYTKHGLSQKTIPDGE